jgi:ABC-type sugar transport system ATPase subunit
MNLIMGRFSDDSVTFSGQNKYRVPSEWKSVLQGALGRDAEVIVGFRPESARLSPQGVLTGEVYAVDMQGGHSMLHVKLLDDTDKLDIVHIRADRRISYPIGTKINLDIEPDKVRFFDLKTEAALQRENGR